MPLTRCWVHVQVLDVYWKELGATCAEFTQLPQAALEGLLEPICNLVGHTDDRITLKRADDGEPCAAHAKTRTASSSFYRKNE